MDDTALDTTLIAVTDDDAHRDGATATSDPADDGVEEDLLIEEVSIDGMCGVY